MAFEFTLELSRRYKEFRRRWRSYVEVIKRLAKEFFKENFLRVYVFGSTVRGDYRALSDIDVAIVLKWGVDELVRVKFRSLIKERLGKIHPFEIHIITEDEWRSWYRRFIKEDYVEV